MPVRGRQSFRSFANCGHCLEHAGITIPRGSARSPALAARTSNASAISNGETLKSNSPGTRRSVATNIRFQLDQLGAQNGHHDFEHLCRQFARERIARNILPATGPVSAGGDQGKDFETFTSFVAKTSGKGTRFFVGAAESKPLVFACSLTARAKLKAKIQADVSSICSAGTPHLVYFFSNQSLIRHEPQPPLV